MAGRYVTIYRNPYGRAGSGQIQKGASSVKAEIKETGRRNPGIYGAAFQSGTEVLNISAPGEIVPVALSSSSLLCGVTHSAGDADMVVSVSGGCEVQFALYLSSDTASIATFSLQANEKDMAGGTWDVPLISGFQIVSGCTMAHLDENSRVRIAVTAASPLALKLSGSGVTASLILRQL